MLLSDTESLTIHASFLIHVDCLLGLLSVDKALFSLSEITSFKLELGLVQEDFGD